MVASPRRRPRPVRPVPARLQAARGPARHVLRAQDGRRPHGAHHVRPLLRVLHRPGREEAAQPLLSGDQHPVLRHRGLQPGVQVLPELGHLEIARDGPPAGPGQPGKNRRRGPQARLQIGRVHVQRPGDLRRVCDGHRRRLPCEGGESRGRHRGLYPCRPAARVLRQDGRRERRPEGFTDDFYFKICGGHLQPVLDTLVYLVKETGVWTEITTLLIPGKNDSDAELEAECKWVMQHLGADVPLHFTAFHPDWKMTDVPPTPPATLTRAREIALRHGLRYVYTGNVHDETGGSTYCPACGNAVIVRDWYDIRGYHLADDGACKSYGKRISGRLQKFGHPFGPKRIPVRLQSRDRESVV